MPDTEDYAELSICEQVRKCWHDGMSVEKEIREEFEKRMRFRAGDQWDAQDVNRRGKDRPAIVVNLLEQPVQQVINTNLRNKPGGQVSPADDAATDEVAEYLQGRIRHVEYESDAQYAYGTCIGYVAAGGFGFVGLTVDYCSPDSLDLEPRIRTIDDPACWMVDPTAKEPDGRDARWAIGRQRYSVEEFKRLWPEAEVIDASWYGQDSTYADWGDGQYVWVAEYWRMEYKKRKLQRFSDGTEGFLDDAEFLRRLPPGVTALPGEGNSAEKQVPVVTQYLVSGADVLEETPWKGYRIPIYKVTANEFYAEGKKVVKSLISDSLPSQQTYNCSESLKLESLVMAPKPKWLASTEQLAGHEQMWKTANTSSDSVLFYNGTQDSRGNPVPPPDWKVFVPPIQQFQLVSDGAKQDVKLETGFFDAALGNFNPQTQSGRAIIALQQQTGLGTTHYSESLAHMLKALYQDLIDIDIKLSIKKIRSMRIIQADGKPALARINDPNAVKQLLMDKGRYSVIVEVGPNQESQRQAAGEFIDTIAQADPNGWALIRDLGAQIKKPQLGHYADEIAKRWVPPQFANQDPNVAPQLQQSQAMIQQLTQRVNEQNAIIQQKQVEEQGKYQREMAVEQQKYATEQLKAETQIRVAELNAKNDFLLQAMDVRVKQLEAAANQWQAVLDRQHELNLQSHKQAHEHGMLAAEHAHAMHKMENAPAPEMPPPATNGPDQQQEVTAEWHYSPWARCASISRWITARFCRSPPWSSALRRTAQPICGCSWASGRARWI